MRPSACDTVSRRCVRPVLCWFAFPLVPALRSTGSAADGSALFASFSATMAGSDFRASSAMAPRLPDADQSGPAWPNAGPPKFRRDPFARDGLFDPGRSAVPRIAALLILRSTIETVSAPAICPFRGSITHPTQPLCTLRGRRYRQLTQHSLPGRLLGLTWVGLAPTDRASLLGAFLSPGYNCISKCLGSRHASNDRMIGQSRRRETFKMRPLPDLRPGVPFGERSVR